MAHGLGNMVPGRDDPAPPAGNPLGLLSGVSMRGANTGSTGSMAFGPAPVRR